MLNIAGYESVLADQYAILVRNRDSMDVTRSHSSRASSP